MSIAVILIDHHIEILRIENMKGASEPVPTDGALSALEFAAPALLAAAALAVRAA